MVQMAGKDVLGYFIPSRYLEGVFLGVRQDFCGEDQKQRERVQLVRTLDKPEYD